MNKYKVYFYKDNKGNQPVLDYIMELSRKKDKDSRINLNKINDYIQALEKYGTDLPNTYLKHIDGLIWELRPIRNRIFFVVWHNNSFILLHHFIKKTQKTPKSEIEKAKRELEYLQKSEQL